ncbi:MAG: secretion protein HlyD, partial [Burkholderiaceae bacterium]
MRHPAAALIALAATLAACTADAPAGYQVYVEGEYVH